MLYIIWNFERKFCKLFAISICATIRRLSPDGHCLSNCTRRHDRIMAVDDVQGDLHDAIGAALSRTLTEGGGVSEVTFWSVLEDEQYWRAGERLFWTSIKYHRISDSNSFKDQTSTILLGWIFEKMRYRYTHWASVTEPLYQNPVSVTWSFRRWALWSQCGTPWRWSGVMLQNRQEELLGEEGGGEMLRSTMQLMKKEVMKMDEAQNGRQRICNISHANWWDFAWKKPWNLVNKKPTNFCGGSSTTWTAWSQRKWAKNNLTHELPSGDFFVPEQT